MIECAAGYTLREPRRDLRAVGSWGWDSLRFADRTADEV
jgi:hypothetical protein